MDITKEDCTMWQVSNKEYAKKGMKTVIDYAEKNGQASPDIKPKLRTITKMLMECDKDKLNEYKPILLLLGQHGNVILVLSEK